MSATRALLFHAPLIGTYKEHMRQGVLDIGMNHSQGARRAHAMASRLGDWPNSWLLLRCGRCRSLKRIPVLLLRRAYGDDHRLGTVVGRLRCRLPGCRARPDYVRLEGRYDAHAAGHLHSVLLVGPGAYG